jgi:hypothetical protein
MTYLKTSTLSDESGEQPVFRQIDLSGEPYAAPVTTRGQAIRQKCIDCICGGHAHGSCTAQITLCTAFDCSLWGFRPVSRAPISAEARKGLPSYLIDSDWCDDPNNFRTRPYVGRDVRDDQGTRYSVVVVYEAEYRASRIGWKMVTDEDPGIAHMRHLDGNPRYNSARNLAIEKWVPLSEYPEYREL